jgi:hypothetical protein
VGGNGLLVAQEPWCLFYNRYRVMCVSGELRNVNLVSQTKFTPVVWRKITIEFFEVERISNTFSCLLTVSFVHTRWVLSQVCVKQSWGVSCPWLIYQAWSSYSKYGHSGDAKSSKQQPCSSEQKQRLVEMSQLPICNWIGGDREMSQLPIF